jgi:hypothetical protein
MRHFARVLHARKRLLVRCAGVWGQVSGVRRAGTEGRKGREQVVGNRKTGTEGLRDCATGSLSTRAPFGDWEQGRRRPDRAARAFLMVIVRHPESVVEALAR